LEKSRAYYAFAEIHQRMIRYPFDIILKIKICFAYLLLDFNPKIPTMSRTNTAMQEKKKT